MKTIYIGAALLLAATIAPAKDQPVYQKGILLQMESTSCGYAQKGGKTVAGEILGTDSENKQTHEVLCQEYTLQTDDVIFRIRPRDEKHPDLLPIGETTQFRVEKDKIKLRVPEMGEKEREYTVVSMTLRDDPADARTARNNH